MFHFYRPQFTRSTQINKIFAVAVGGVIASATHSKHSREAHGVVSHAEVWKGVEINEPRVIV